MHHSSGIYIRQDTALLMLLFYLFDLFLKRVHFESSGLQSLKYLYPKMVNVRMLILWNLLNVCLVLYDKKKSRMNKKIMVCAYFYHSADK